jgi:hypothetical protein
MAAKITIEITVEGSAFDAHAAASYVLDAGTFQDALNARGVHVTSALLVSAVRADEDDEDAVPRIAPEDLRQESDQVGTLAQRLAAEACLDTLTDRLNDLAGKSWTHDLSHGLGRLRAVTAAVSSFLSCVATDDIRACRGELGTALLITLTGLVGNIAAALDGPTDGNARELVRPFFDLAAALEEGAPVRLCAGAQNGLSRCDEDHLRRGVACGHCDPKGAEERTAALLGADPVVTAERLVGGGCDFKPYGEPQCARPVEEVGYDGDRVVARSCGDHAAVLSTEHPTWAFRPTAPPPSPEPSHNAVREAKVTDAMRWVVQEARALKLAGVELPRGSRLREALAALDEATRTPTH